MLFINHSVHLNDIKQSSKGFCNLVGQLCNVVLLIRPAQLLSAQHLVGACSNGTSTDVGTGHHNTDGVCCLEETGISPFGKKGVFL